MEVNQPAWVVPREGQEQRQKGELRAASLSPYRNLDATQTCRQGIPQRQGSDVEGHQRYHERLQK